MCYYQRNRITCQINLWLDLVFHVTVLILTILINEINLVTILLVIYSWKCAASMFSDLKLSFYNMQGSTEQLKFRISQNLWHRKVAMSNFLIFIYLFIYLLFLREYLQSSAISSTRLDTHWSINYCFFVLFLF